MIIACPECATRYAVPDEAIGIDGRMVRCAKCKHSWFQEGHGIVAPPEREVAQQEEPSSDAQPPAGRRPQEPAASAGGPGRASAARVQGTSAAPPDSAQNPPPMPPKPSEPAQAHAMREASSSHDGEGAKGGFENPERFYEEEHAGEPLPPPRFSDSSNDRSSDRPNDDAAEHWQSGDDEGGQAAGQDDESGLGAAPAADPIHGASPPASAPTSAPDNHRDFVGQKEEGLPAYDRGSQFDYSPPFRPRRNPLKLWTGAAASFAVLALGSLLAVSYLGVPQWLPVQQPTWALDQSQLEIDFPPEQRSWHELSNGEQYYGISGTITNISRDTASVPAILLRFKDERDRAIFDWVLEPGKQELAPGETITVTEASSQVPVSATDIEIGWKYN